VKIARQFHWRERATQETTVSRRAYPERSRGGHLNLFPLAGWPTFDFYAWRSSHRLPGLRGFESWAFVLRAPVDFRRRDSSVALNVKIYRFLQHRAHASSNTAKRGAAEVWMGQSPTC